MKTIGYLIVKGNPVAVLNFIGPFSDRDDAVQFAETHIAQSDDWCIAEIETPNSEDSPPVERERRDFANGQPDPELTFYNRWVLP